jgi:hypothetical protein
MAMRDPEKLLTLLLRVSAAVTLLAFPCALLPVSWMDWTHQQLGLGELPRDPIVIYMARSLSLLYGMHGAVTLALSLDVRRYLPVIRVMAVLMVLFAGAMVLVDRDAGLRWYWVAGEGPSLGIFYGLIAWCAFRVPDRPA